MPFTAHRTLRFKVSSQLEQVAPSTQSLFKFLEELKLDESECFDLRLAFEELLINAMKHGNGLKADLPVEIQAAFNDEEIRIKMTDQGSGFNYQKLKDPTVGQNLEAQGGRGVYLAKRIMDDLTFEAPGNVVQLIKVYGRMKK